jgi:hypothetical protein
MCWLEALIDKNIPEMVIFFAAALQQTEELLKNTNWVPLAEDKNTFDFSNQKRTLPGMHAFMIIFK